MSIAPPEPRTTEPRTAPPHRRTTSLPVAGQTEPGVLIRRATPCDLPPLRAMLRRCSAATVRDRLHGAGTHGALARGLTRSVDGSGSAVLVARRGLEVVGCLELIGSGLDDGKAELALLVEDAWQGRGIGRRLVEAVPECVGEAGWSVVGFSVESGNHRGCRLLRGIAVHRLSGRWEQGCLDVTVRVHGAGGEPR